MMQAGPVDRSLGGSTCTVGKEPDMTQSGNLSSSEQDRLATYDTEPTGWTGWIVFGGTIMIVLGTFHAFQGLVAIFKDEYYLVGKNGLTVNIDYTAWGWTHLLLGIVVALAGAALMAGQMWARVLAVFLAFVSAIVNVGFLAAYPIWSSMMIGLDILVMWAVIVHGREMKTLR
jgi:hypothetical protein